MLTGAHNQSRDNREGCYYVVVAVGDCGGDRAGLWSKVCGVGPSGLVEELDVLVIAHTQLETTGDCPVVEPA